MEEIEQWSAALDVLMIRIGPRFARSEARARAKDRLKGLLRPTERKNDWQLAETVGDTTPYGFQQLLCRSPWNPNDVRDDLRDCVVKPLGDDDAVLVVDDTGFLKKGAQSVGVARQCSGAAGRIETSRVGVFLAYASWRGAAFVDRWLYPSERWTDDRTRRRAVGIPDAEPFTTKPQGAVGLDHDEARSWQGWHRCITLACWVPAFLAVMRAQAGGLSVELQKGGPPTQPSSLAAFKAQCRSPSA
jgi:SRSO17 transposase